MNELQCDLYTLNQFYEEFVRLRDAFINAVSPIVQAVILAVKRVWEHVRRFCDQKIARPSKQTRAFLYVMRGRTQFTPHVSKRKISSRRAHIYMKNYA